MAVWDVSNTSHFYTFEKEQAEWVNSQIELLPFHLRKKALTNYGIVRDEAWFNEPIEYRKRGRSAQAANKRLKAYVKKVTILMNAKTKRV